MAERAEPVPAGETTRPAGPGLGLTPAGEQIADRLMAAATGGRDGVLQVVGEPGGLVYLAGGRVSLVQTRAVPGVDVLVLHRLRDTAGRRELLAAMSTSEGRDTVTAEAAQVLLAGVLPPVELDVVHQQSVADAAFALLAVDGTTFVRSRFFRGERPWTQLSDPLPVDDVLAEVARRRRYATRTAGTVQPGSRPVRTDRLPVTSVRLNAAQWDLVVHADGTRTTTDLAWALGRGVFPTILEVSRLERLGLLDIPPGRPSGRGTTAAVPEAPSPAAAAGAPANGGEGDPTSLVPARGGPHG